MTKEEAIDILETTGFVAHSMTDVDTALDMAIEALQTPPITQRRMYQAGYRQGREDALKREPSEDLISRAEAIEAIELVDWYHQNKNKDMVSGANDDEHQAWYKADDVYKALEAVPSADRPRGEWHKNVEYSATGNERAMADQCSVCSGMVPWGMSDKFDFCPNCGADMKGGQND